MRYNQLIHFAFFIKKNYPLYFFYYIIKAIKNKKCKNHYFRNYLKKNTVM